MEERIVEEASDAGVRRAEEDHGRGVSRGRRSLHQK